jgi:hypothetical protein
VDSRVGVKTIPFPQLTDHPLGPDLQGLPETGVDLKEGQGAAVLRPVIHLIENLLAHLLPFSLGTGAKEQNDGQQSRDMEGLPSANRLSGAGIHWILRCRLLELFLAVCPFLLLS